LKLRAALQEYLKGAPNSAVDNPKTWYQAALIAFREVDYVAACTYLRRGIAANPYMAEVTQAHSADGAPVLARQQRARPRVGGGLPGICRLRLDGRGNRLCGLGVQRRARPQQACRMGGAERVGLNYKWDAVQLAAYSQKSMAFINRITDTLSKKMVRKVKNRWGDEIWPWDRSPR